MDSGPRAWIGIAIDLRRRLWFPVWSADGSNIFFRSNRDGTSKVYQKAANGAGPETLVEAAEKLPMDASRDGRWLAYQSNASQHTEIYVVRFPNPGLKWQISPNGGRDAVWTRDGHELYYYSLDNKIMAVDIKPGAQFRYGVPKPLFDVRISGNNVSLDVSKDGRFLLPALVEDSDSTPMTVVLNWPQLLKKK